MQLALCVLIPTSMMLAMLVASWRHPIVPAFQMRVLWFAFRVVWTVSLRRRLVGRQPTFVSAERYLVPATPADFAELQQTVLRQRVRPDAMQYFFSGFVYPFLPLDLTGSGSASWRRIYAAFTAIMTGARLERRCPALAQSCLDARVSPEATSLHDSTIRALIVDIMWRALTGASEGEPAELEARDILYALVEDVSHTFTQNLDPDWGARLAACRRLAALMHELAEHTPHVEAWVELARRHRLSRQEWLTVIVMEFVVTPALEIGETVTNILREAEADPDMARRAIADEAYMRGLTHATACKYPVLQSLFRARDATDVPCHVGVDHAVEQADLPFCPEAFMSGDPPAHRWVAFGAGPRACKGQTLAVAVTGAILRAIASRCGRWPAVIVTSGRRVRPSASLDERFVRLHGRAWIGRVLYAIDRRVRPGYPVARVLVPDPLLAARPEHPPRL